MATVEQLNLATTSGNLCAAFGLLNNLPEAQAEELILRAGFTSLGTRKKKEFWADVQRQITAACAAKTDGFGLRAEREGGLL